MRYVPRLNKIANVLAIRQVKQIGGVPKFRNLANLSKISTSIFSRPLALIIVTTKKKLQIAYKRKLYTFCYR